mmetsp:Transcript_98188/g.293317  ORF Transcript_98188/g.293317 Transcript_98188/m.293317 type:complete len:447 (+) Transcript_98188:67-1407(+)
MGCRLTPLLLLAAAAWAQSSGFTYSNAPADALSLVQIEAPPSWFAKLGNLIKKTGPTGKDAAGTRDTALDAGSRPAVARGQTSSGSQQAERSAAEERAVQKAKTEKQLEAKKAEAEQRQAAMKREEEEEARRRAAMKQKEEEQVNQRAAMQQQEEEEEASSKAEDTKRLELAKLMGEPEVSGRAGPDAARPGAETRPREQPAPPVAVESKAALDPEAKRLQELHDKVLREMREKIMAEADAAVKRQMREKHAARMEELKRQQAEEAERMKQQQAAKAEQQRLAEEEARQKKLDMERAKAERLQAWKIKQQMKLEAEREAVRKRKAAADRLADQQRRKTQIGKRREEEARRHPASEEVTEFPEGDANFINVRLQDGLNREITLKVARAVRLKAMMMTACQRFGLDRDYASFSFNDRPIRFTDTPESVGLQNGDIISALEVADGEFTE